MLARPMNCFPPRSGPSIGRLARRGRGRVEHADEGWRPFAVPQEAALHLWRGVSSGFLTCRTHWCGAYQRASGSEEFVELALGPPIFFGQTLEDLTIGEMAQFD